MNEEEFAEMAAGFALNALPPAELTAFEQARREHPEWEQHVMSDTATTARLLEVVPPVEPPPGIRAALLAQIATTPQTSSERDGAPQSSAARGVDGDPMPAQTRAQTRANAQSLNPQSPTAQSRAAAEPRRRFGSRSWFALAASLVLLVGVGWGAVFVSEQLTAPASVVALQEIQDAPDVQSASAELSDGGQATAYWSESVGKSVLVSDGLPALADDESFEMWFVRDGAAVSAGTFSADGGTATALLAGDVEPGDVIAVTVEAAGGSETGQPTTDPIIAIPTA